MKAIQTWLLLSLACLIMTACAFRAPLTLTPINSPNERLQFEGFSILPPNGQNWFISKGGPPDKRWTVLVGFAKKLRDKPVNPAQAEMNFALVKTRSLAHLPATKPDEILRYLAQELENENKLGPEPGISNFYAVTYIEKYQGHDCVRYQIYYEVDNWRPFPGYVFVMETKGYLFTHPDSPTTVIGLEYDQRYLKGEKPYPLEPEVEPFLESLEFTSLGRPT